ncbi:hypothetical protein C8J56DRAFT_1000917 [Mycena floridula]|nr:hypothetical protein C8J56DRAFT_1000917 [Mycena floridula]
MANIGSIYISPALLNSSCAWASDFEQLSELYQCRFTGAVTTRTSSIDGSSEDESYKVAFSASGTILQSPAPEPSPSKPFIISITASSAEDLSKTLALIQQFRAKIYDIHPDSPSRIAIEFNTSCPNIAGSPPQGYILDSDASILAMLQVIADEVRKDQTFTAGLKLPPYIYRDQFVSVVKLISSMEFVGTNGVKRNPFAFFTCTNTLGSSLLFGDQVLESTGEFAVPTVFGGLAGDGLHALALGNVRMFSQLLEGQLISIIGVGGVTSPDAAQRMRAAGAKVVACATLLGKEGTRAFEMLQ